MSKIVALRAISIKKTFTWVFAAQKELDSIISEASVIPKEVVFALKHVCQIAFRSPADSIDKVVEMSNCESELKPLLLFVLKNHFGDKSSPEKSETPAGARPNVIQVVMNMLKIAFDPSNDPYSR